MTYIGIEGSSYTGKTTTIRRLEHAGHATIPEYDAFGPLNRSHSTFDDFYHTINQLIEREHIRTRMLGHYANKLHVFSDRTPISLVTFEEMRILTANTKQEKEAHIRARDYAIDLINKGVQRGNILLPDAFAILHLSTRQAFEDRVQRRGVTEVTELAQFEVQQYIAAHSLEYSLQLAGTANATVINVDALQESDVVAKIEDLANSTSPQERVS